MTSWVARRTALAAPLDEAFAEALAAVGRARGYPTFREPTKLGVEVRALSDAYNAVGKSTRSHLGARLGFSFARDVPKSGAALAELLLHGPPLPARPSVLDLGAGLGATTLGVARALAASGHDGGLDAVLVEPDEGARALGADLSRALPQLPGAPTLTWRSGSVEAPPPGKHDLVFLGQVLSEMGHQRPDRPAWLAQRVGALLTSHVNDGGALVIVEPALRERTRVLQAVRDALAPRVFAPCTREGPCPMLAREADWCHEDLPIDLPPWLVPTARAAGLRHEGLTFSYLVLRHDGARVSTGARVVAQPRATKGKLELDLCRASGLVRVDRLTRDETEQNAVFGDAARGDLLQLPDGPRVGRETDVRWA